MPILSIANQKGGVGKTTTTRNLGHELAKHGPTLMIDLDSQHTLTSLTRKPYTQTMVDVLGTVKEGTVALDDVLVEIEPNLWIAPSSVDLADTEAGLTLRTGRELKLRKALSNMQRQFDWILLDCPPSLSWITTNALLASDYLIVPIHLAVEAIDGIKLIFTRLQDIQADFGKVAKVMGVLTVDVDMRTNLSKRLLKQLRSVDYLRTFDSQIPHTIRFKEAAAKGLPIALYEPNSVGAIAYQQFAEEVIGRGSS